MRRLVEEHLRQRLDHGNRIWLLLAAEVWYRQYICRQTQDAVEHELAEGRGDAARVSVGGGSAG